MVKEWRTEKLRINVDRLSKSYGTSKVLKDVTFTIDSGEIVALIGANGAGKTTAIKCITKLANFDQGNIFIGQTDIKEITTETYKLSYIPDTPVYFEQLTVLENLQFICAAYEKDFIEIDVIVEKLDLQEYLSLLPDKLSRGNKQKLMIAAALLKDFNILIADEPFNGLDPIQVKKLKNILQEQKDQGKIVLVSTHLLDLAQTFCDKFVILEKGRVILESSREQLLQWNDTKDQNITVEQAYLKLLSKDYLEEDNNA